MQWVPYSIAGLSQVGTPRAMQVQTSDSGDVLWIAGSSALMRVDQPETMPATPPRMPLLRAVVRNDSGEGMDPDSNQLPYTTRRLQLQFSTTEFGRRETLRYQTLLEGVDQNWSAPTNIAELELANLREGDYNFKVRLLADTGAVSAPNTWHFSIAAPWWRTPYAYAGYVGALALILTGLYRLRIRSIRRRAEVLEQTVRLRTAELEKANAAKTEFVASMSHEIRNPMNGIIGSAHALADTPLNPEQIEMVNTLRNCATFLSSLVEDVLDFSSIEAGVFTTQQLAFNPAEIIESVAAMLATHATEAGAHFDLEIDPVLPARLIGDPARIQQIVVNYATNALKFSGGGRVRLSVYTENNHVVYAVTDNGPGITTDEQSVLFTRFSRLKTARNAGVTGTGLGLAVCRAVAERMNGSVGVDSSPDRGATFYLRLPLARAGAEAEIITGQNLPSLEGARALVVEDLAYNSRVLNAMLGKFGLGVDLTSNGTDALCKFAVNSYHVIFLDYDLPDMSGLEVARRMRALSTGPSRPLIVATTAYSTVQDRDACLKAGMDLFLSKPITPEKLQGALACLTHQMGPALPVPVSAKESAGYNLQILTYLAGDAPGALDREIGRFLDAVSDVHREVRAALRTSDRGALAKAAHRMLSHARMIEDNSLSTLAGEIEIEAGYADLARLELLATDMANAITRLRKMLVRHRAVPSLA
ncbi:MAG: response regulator [Cephaloticoccus sp.]|nr:response regulator [Cephaloticoccus sp.]